MLVKFIRPHYKYSYFPGDKAEIDAREADSLVTNGFAVSVEHKAEKPEKPAKSNAKGK